MSNYDLVVAGRYNENGTFSQITVDPDTGTAILDSITQGRVVMSAIDVTDPINTESMNEQAVSNLCRTLGEDVSGFILSKNALIVLYENTAVYLNPATRDEIQRVTFDTDVEYDGDSEVY